MNCERLQIVALRTAILWCVLFALAPIGLLRRLPRFMSVYLTDVQEKACRE